MLKTSYSHPDLVASKSSQQGRSGQQRAGLGLCAAFFCSCSQVLDNTYWRVTISKAASSSFFSPAPSLSLLQFHHYFLSRYPCYFKVSLLFAGAEEELGRGTQRVPVPLGLHRLHTKEDSQAEAGRRNEAAGTRHQCHREAQDYLHCQQVNGSWQFRNKRRRRKIHGGHKNKPMLFEEDCKENKKFSPKM